MYRKNPDAAKRIHQEEVLAKQKALILVGETLLLSTIRFDFNIQHPYEPLKLALKNLGISQMEVRQLAMSFINDMLPTTLVVQFKPHFIAAGSLFHAAKFHNFVLPAQDGKVWWNQFDVAPRQLQAVIQQMTEFFKKREPCSMGSVNKSVPTPTPTPTDKHQIKPPPTPALMDKQKIKPIPSPTLTDRQQKIRIPDPAPRHTQSSMRSLSSSNTEASRCVPAGSSFDKPVSSLASNEENQYRRTDEENQYRQRAKEENQYRRTNEQNQHNQYRRTNEQNQHRRTDEEKQYHGRMNEENRYRWTNEQNRHRRTCEENQHRWMNGENQYMRTNGENQYRQTNEENQYPRTNEENQYRRTHTNHNLVPVDQRLEKQSHRGTLKADRGYHATIIMDLTRQKRRIQDVGRLPAPVYISDRNDWRIGSLKKQKLDRR
ncbi:unnamed protein product [Urochloa humidicola]